MNKRRLETDEEAFFTDYRATQLKVGALLITTQTSNSLGANNFYYGIRIFKDNGTPSWGEVIFEGTLKELVDLIHRANQCPFIKEGNQCNLEKS